jgi:hypothetical protein
VQRRLDDLVTIHLAMVERLESRVPSPATRNRLEVLRYKLEREIALLLNEPEGMVAD